MATFQTRACVVRSLPLSLCVLVSSSMAWATALAQQQPPRPADETVPENAAVLELLVPDTAEVFINGGEYGKRRIFTFPGMEPGQIYRYECEVAFVDGSRRKRSVLLQGGWHVRLSLAASAPTRPELVPQTGHALSVWSVAFSPDGRYVLTGSMDMSAVLWDAVTGKQLRTLRGHTQPVTGVAFSPDGRQALTGSMEGAAILWNPRTGRKLRTFRLSAGTAIWSVAFSPDGRYVLTDATLWNAETGTKLRTFDAGGQSVRAVAFSRDGRLALAGTFGPNPTVTLWNGQTGGRLRNFTGHSRTVTSVAFSPDARMAVTASEDGTAIVWEVQTGRALHTLRGHTQEIRSVAFHPDGRQILTGSLDETAVVWDAQTGERQHTYRARGLFPGQEKVWAVAFSPDGAKALAGVGHNAAVLWDNRTREQIVKYEGATTVVGAAAFSPDGRRARMVAGLWGLDWDAAAGQPVGGGVALDEIPASPITAVAFDKDARHVLVSLQDGTDHLYDVHTGRELQVFRNHAGGLYNMAVNPDGRWALTGSNSATAYLWEVATGQRHDLAGHAAQPFSVAVSSDGRHAATGGFDGAAILWDLASRRQVQTFRGSSGVVAIAVRADGRQVLTAGSDNTASLWDTASGRRVHTLKGHNAWVWSCAFSPDGRYLLTGGWDNKINVWDAGAGTLVRSFLGHSGWVTSVQLSPDNRYLLSASFDGTARMWDVATGDELAALVGLNYAKDWLVITPDGLFDGSRVGREMVSFRFGEELNVVPVDRFFQDFYRPGLLNELWRGGRPAPEVQLGASQPPSVKILAPGRGGVVETDRIALEVELADRGGGVRGPWLVQNGARLLLPGNAETTGNVVSRRFDVALVEGENRFEIRATSADGSWESEPAVVILRYERPLPKPEMHLVAVGVGRYEEESLGLEFARGDAEAMAGLFRERGASLYEQVHVTSVKDEHATRAAILQTIRDAARKANPQDTMVVYFAGHGAVVGSQYYFLPSDFHRQTDSVAEDVRGQGLTAADVGEAMAAAAALKRLLVFDTGQSRGRIAATRTARNPFAFRGAIERLSRTEGAFTIAASAVSDQVPEVSELGHGILTYTLLAGMRAAGDGPLESQWIEPADESRVAHVLEWFGFAAAHAPRLAQQFHGQPQDVQHASLGTSFPLLPVPGEAVAVAAKPEAAELPEEPTTAPRPAADTEDAPPTDRPTAHVVAVGINRYRDETMNLRFAASDAEAICKLFDSRGAGLYGGVRPKAVLDEDATRAGILGALRSVAETAGEDDLVLLFLAGHGAMVGQRYYFIPHEFQRQADALEEDVRGQGIPADELADELADVKAMKQILIFDTCASGSILELGRTLRDPMAFRGVVERLGRRKGVFTIAATAAGKEAQEVGELKHGALTYALLAAMEAVPPGPLEGKTLRPGNPQGVADVLEWFSFASGHVPRLTRRYLGSEQFVQTSGQGTSFLVLPARKD